MKKKPTHARKLERLLMKMGIDAYVELTSRTGERWHGSMTAGVIKWERVPK